MILYPTNGGSTTTTPACTEVWFGLPRCCMLCTYRTVEVGWATIYIARLEDILRLFLAIPPDSSYLLDLRVVL